MGGLALAASCWYGRSVPAPHQTVDEPAAVSLAVPTPAVETAPNQFEIGRQAGCQIGFRCVDMAGSINYRFVEAVTPAFGAYHTGDYARAVAAATGVETYPVDRSIVLQRQPDARQ